MFQLSDYSENEIKAARGYAASTTLKCAAHCFDSDYGFAEHITELDKAKYQQHRIDSALEILDGLKDDNFTIRQRMEYYLTGKSTPLLPK